MEFPGFRTFSVSCYVACLSLALLAVFLLLHRKNSLTLRFCFPFSLYSVICIHLTNGEDFFCFIINEQVLACGQRNTLLIFTRKISLEKDVFTRKWFHISFNLIYKRDTISRSIFICKATFKRRDSINIQKMFLPAPY